MVKQQAPRFPHLTGTRKTFPLQAFLLNGQSITSQTFQENDIGLPFLQRN